MQILTSQNSTYDFLSKYDVFFIDLWGVVHSGDALRPGIKSALEFLVANNKQVIFFSNAPRKAIHIANQLKKLGITTNLYDKIVTSGETARSMLSSGEVLKDKKKFFPLWLGKDNDLLTDLDFEEVQNVADAEFILNLGFYSFDDAKKAKIPEFLEDCNLPMFCCNPDISVEKGNETLYCAGYIAKFYEAHNGNVTYCGKPHRQMYELAASYAKSSNILAIGDSFYTDILGANNYGVDSMLVMNGIFRKYLLESDHFSQSKFNELSNKYDAIPTVCAYDL